MLLPNEATNKFGDFWYGGDGEQVYAATDFGSSGVPALLLTGVEFRVDESHTNAFGGESYAEIDLYVFPGTMDEIVRRKSGIPDQSNLGRRVFEGNILLPTSNPDPKEFNIKFDFQRPFIYRLDAGQLVLVFPYSFGPMLDAQGLYSIPGNSGSGVVFDRGVHITAEFLGERAVHPSMFVTRFSYRTVFAEINSIRKLGMSVEIEFTQYGAEKVELEAAYDPLGPYSIEPRAEIRSSASGRLTATVPISQNARFFRVRAF